MYENNLNSIQSQRSDVKNFSYSVFQSTGREDQIKNRILICLHEKPMTARQLSERIICMRSSVCKPLVHLLEIGLVSDKETTYDHLTSRTVTLYSLVNTSKVV